MHKIQSSRLSLVSIPEDDDTDRMTNCSPFQDDPLSLYCEYKNLRRASLAETLLNLSQDELLESYFESTFHPEQGLQDEIHQTNPKNIENQPHIESTESLISIPNDQEYQLPLSDEPLPSLETHATLSLKKRIQTLESQLKAETIRNESSHRYISSLEQELVEARLRNRELEAEGWACSAQVVALKERILEQECRHREFEREVVYGDGFGEAGDGAFHYLCRLSDSI
ncbi:UNVERIFIED_CONTAM: hypothetical protein HDU68_010187 [Siphonaria sp. JEL0065]|nr:hypothetical protein HDU68_010187 [Siphonaria sp. JEL0065]